MSTVLPSFIRIGQALGEDITTNMLFVAVYGVSLQLIIDKNGLNCRWFMQCQHVDPDEAWKIHNDVGAYNSIGVHWGTFKFSDEVLISHLLIRTTAAKSQN